MVTRIGHAVDWKFQHEFMANFEKVALCSNYKFERLHPAGCMMEIPTAFAGTCACVLAPRYSSAIHHHACGCMQQSQP